MAYGALRFTIHRREKANLTTAEGRGLFSQPAEWKGMGSSGYTKPPPLTVSSCLGYILVFLSATFILSVSGMHSSKTEDCQFYIQQCSEAYDTAKQDLGIKGPGPHERKAICMAIRTYKDCIYPITNSCNGNLMFYTSRNFVTKTMENNGCDEVGPKVEPPVSKGPVAVPALCDSPGKGPSKLCVLFGDPHLRTFGDDFQTCKVKGAWPLVNNDYLAVQVTSTEVEGTVDATATTKLTVIVKGNPDCTSKNFQTYQAHTNSLPGTFEDGGTVIGPYHSLELVEVDPGRHVEIHIRYIKTIVVIRQVGRYFTFSISMPEDLVNESSKPEELQLCMKGCPQAELINYQDFLSKRRHSSPKPPEGASRQYLTSSQAEHICKEAKLVDFFYDSCVFDLLTTGDQNFTMSAYHALQDMVKLQPSSVREMANRTSLAKGDLTHRSHGSRINRAPHFLLILFVLTSFMCKR